ncbi:hypothetical protein ACTA71_012292 [Dictyostelium dimigraforme]
MSTVSHSDGLLPDDPDLTISPLTTTDTIVEEIVYNIISNSSLFFQEVVDLSPPYKISKKSRNFLPPHLIIKHRNLNHTQIKVPIGFCKVEVEEYLQAFAGYVGPVNLLKVILRDMDRLEERLLCLNGGISSSL